MPVDAPLYPAPPLRFQDAQFVVLTYETDADAAAAVLPAGLTLPLPALVTVTMAHYPASSVGSYTEAIQQIQCEWEGQRRSYVSKILLDNDAAIAAGREIYGFPKKHAFVELKRAAGEFTGTLERPLGHRLLSVTMSLQKKLKAPTEQGEGHVLALRVIPNAEGSGQPSIAELVETKMLTTVKEAWTGVGSLEFGPPSEADPWSALPVQKLLGASHAVLDFEMPAGCVLKRYQCERHDGG
jgi:acetoacetate decarboxylase